MDFSLSMIICCCPRFSRQSPLIESRSLSSFALLGDLNLWLSSLRGVYSTIFPSADDRGRELQTMILNYGGVTTVARTRSKMKSG